MARKTKHQHIVYKISIFFLYTFLWCSSHPFCSARDTLRQGDSILDDEDEENSLVSAGGMFKLGFFTPNGIQGGKRYVGIWYHNLRPRTFVWVANRNKPVLINSSTSTGVFGISEDGNLEVFDDSDNGKSYWSTNLDQSSSSSSNRTVTLMDSGNLVLKEYDDQLGMLWESFKAPTDTFLPGMKMDESLTLTSWRDQDDPGIGDFRFKLDIEGKNQFVIQNKSAPYWKSGEQGKFFSSNKIPDVVVKFLSNFREQTKCVRNVNCSYTKLVINSTGTVLFETWVKGWVPIWLEPRDRCSQFNVCGNFGSCSPSKKKRSPCKCLPGFKPSLPEKWNTGDFSNGCNRGTELCSGENDTFLSLKMMKVGNPDSTGLSVNNETECRKECLSDCKCQAYSFQAVDQNSRRGEANSSAAAALCWIWYEDLNNLQEEYVDGGHDLFARVALSDIKSTASNCDPCGTTMIPYPLSTGPNCGDPMYSSFRCNNSNGRVSFKASSGTEYQVIRIDQSTRTFVIQLQGMDNCEARNSRGNNLLFQQPSPFSFTNLCYTNDSRKDRDEVEIGWEPPLEPTCTSQASCREWPHSTCSVNETGIDRKKRCYCTTNLKWDGISLNCTGKQEGITHRPSEEEPSRKRIALSLIIIPTVIGVIVLACVVISFFIWRRKMAKRQENTKLLEQKRNRAALRPLDSERHIQDLMDSGDFKGDDGEVIDVPFFNLESILAATDDFSNENKLGQGGYGPVYKGTFPQGQEIAIKRLSSVSGQGLQEFKNEVVLIAKLQHRNLVRLRGYCIERDEKILLYEYMPNKSLDLFIFDNTKNVLLKWETRFDIILGIARGLLYLHQDSRLRIIHRDLKTSNILLDHEMNPKISDFGLARMVGGKQTEANTSRIVGTYGYMSPEYALEGAFSVKSDVFSFGVVLLEIISGKSNTKFVHSDRRLSLLGYAWKLWTESKVLDLMDQTLQESCKEDQFIKCVNVGLLCVQDDPSDRPNMSNVITLLDSDSATLPSPKQPAFILKRGLGSSSTASSSTKPETYTEITLTMEETR